jgi:hypothetical protein
VCKSFLSNGLRSLVMNCTCWSCENWMFHFVWSISIVRRLIVLHRFSLNVIHHWTISYLIFYFNPLILSLSRALCRSVISNFHLLKLFILSTVRFFQTSLQVSAFWRRDSLLVQHYLLSITVQAICIIR